MLLVLLLVLVVFHSSADQFTHVADACFVLGVVLVALVMVARPLAVGPPVALIEARGPPTFATVSAASPPGGFRLFSSPLRL